jgi:ABC-type dipeptide/oligopeptide/nickel transport system permease component
VSGGTARYLLGRLVGLLLVVLALTVFTFTLMHLVPGGPFVFEKQPLPPFAMENINRKYGLDQPVWVQYLRWLWAVLHFDFGIPFQSPTETVLGLIQRAWPVTLAVGLLTLAVAYGLGMLAGVVAAMRPNSWLDRLVTLVATLGLTLPNFIIGFLLIFILSVQLHLLPTGGWGSPKQLIMPVIAYSLGPLAIVARYTRTSMLEVLRADYVRLARARGLPEGRVLRRYVLRTALLPLITVLGPAIPDLLTGSIFIETTFTLPGIGRFFTTSALTRDYPMIMAMMLLVAFLWGFTYLISDLLYVVADPRVRLGGGRL